MSNKEDSSNDVHEFKTLKFGYNRLLRLYLSVTGSWPGEMFGEKVSYFSLFQRGTLEAHTVILVIGQIHYIYYNVKRLSFFELGQIYITLLLTATTHVRTRYATKKEYGILTKFYVTTFDLEHFKYNGPYAEKINQKVQKYSYHLAFLTTAVCVGGIILFNILPLHHNFQVGALTNKLAVNATPEFTVYYSFPGFEPVKYFWPTTVMNMYYTINCGVLLFFYDMYLTFLAIQLIGHLKVLLHNLQNFEKPKKQSLINNIDVSIYDEEENVIVFKKLGESINHHKLIVKFSDDLSSLFGPLFAFNYFFQLISSCLLLLECSQLDVDTVARYGPLTSVVFLQLIQISVTFQIVSNESEKLIDAVYGMPWECMDIRNKRSLCLFLNRVQAPIQILALGVKMVGVQTMAQILKTTFSYYTFLRSIN